MEVGRTGRTKKEVGQGEVRTDKVGKRTVRKVGTEEDGAGWK